MERTFSIRKFRLGIFVYLKDVRAQKFPRTDFFFKNVKKSGVTELVLPDKAYHRP